MGCSFGSNAAADGPATRSTEEVLAIEGAIGAAGPGAQADVALLGQHLSPEVTPARRSRFTTLAGAAQGETGRGFRGFT